MNKNKIKNKIKPFNKVLIANRGEIAIRVIRACIELDIITVAIYSEEDYLSLHRIKADEAYLVGKGKGPVQAYLDIEGIIELAIEKNVDAIHPGYGFLSENPDFAKACKKAGIKFIGPSADAIFKMGDKAEGRKIAEKVGVPTVPGTEDFIKTDKDAIEFATKAGYPVLIKAAYGGGGRGIRICKDKKSLLDQISEARQEAKNAFGNDAILIEKFLIDPKHIEVQILADEYGNVVHLFERDCSVQRRHQKVVEIAPSITLSEELKNNIYDAAVKIAKGANYKNAGTVEFLVDSDENFYFIEMNTRIQVEHTVTEMVTGIDLVKAQIRIAEGYSFEDKEIKIPAQDKIELRGNAIQCRITTENPKENFRPDIGHINAYRSPGGFGVRLDAASAFVGAAITPFYDSMLVKLTTWGTSFDEATSKMDRALDEFKIRGVSTNIPFLKNVISNPVFKNGECKTTFLEKNPQLFNIEEDHDNTTRILNFIGDVTINSAIERPSKWETNPPKIFDLKVAQEDDSVPEHRKIFLENGPEALSKWILKQKKLLVTDTTFRDAHQSLLATRMRTFDILGSAEFTSQAEKDVFSFEMWGGATFDVCMRFLHESPWQRIAKLREKIPNGMFQMLLRGSNAVGYTNYPDNVVDEFIKKAASNGIDIFRIFDCFNWVENMKLAINSALETGKVVEAAICYSGDITDEKRDKYTLGYYVDVAKQLAKLGVHIIAIKDMAGLCKPFAAEKLIKAIKEETGLPLHFHTHATSGNGEATILKASEAGVDIVDLAISSLSGTTAQPSLNAVVAALEGSKRDTGLDINKLNMLTSYWESVRELYFPFETDMKSPNADVYIYEIPGGQYTNLRAQATSLGLGDRWEEVKRMYADVNQLFGDIIKVTPSSKVVGDMSLFLVQNGLTTEDILNSPKNISFPESVVEMLRGDLGQPYKGFPKKILKVVLNDEKPSKTRPGKHIKNIDLKKEINNLKKKFDEDIDENDLLSYLLYPKVFEDFYKKRTTYGDISVVPTKAFYYGMEPGEEINIIDEEGKSTQIKLFAIGETESNGMAPLLFEVNGHPRPVRVVDSSSEIKTVKNEKADSSIEGHIASPLAGKVMNYLVEVGDKISSDQPLFVIEAMKMQTNVKSQIKGKVKRIVIEEGANAEAGDLVLEIESD